MRSSWISRSHCVNVEVGLNKFVILPSVTDNYFTMREETRSVISSTDLINRTQLGRNMSRLGRKNNKGRTFLFSLSLTKVSARLRSDIERAPHLYLSTFLSAALKDNRRCLDYLQSGSLLFTEKCFTALGLTDDPWSSPCITDLSHDVVRQIFDANSSVIRLSTDSYSSTFRNRLRFPQ